MTAPAGASMDGPTALSLPVPMRAEHITKVFPGTTALDDVSFDVHEGRVNVLVGENGAGKSTLMKILAGVEQPTEGRVLIDGKPVVLPSVTAAADHGVGIIFQELNLSPNLSVLDNLFLAQEIVRGGVHRQEGGEAAGHRAARAPGAGHRPRRAGQQPAHRAAADRGDRQGPHA